MASVGNQAPDFTATIVAEEDGTMVLSDRLSDEAPIVLVFFPGPFTPTCTDELTAFQDDLDTYNEIGATIYAVHTDTPKSLEVFRDQSGIEFSLLSDTARNVVDAYDVRRDFEQYGLIGVPDRAVFVIDSTGKITYKWIADNISQEPDYELIKEAVRNSI